MQSGKGVSTPTDAVAMAKTREDGKWFGRVPCSPRDVWRLYRMQKEVEQCQYKWVSSMDGAEARFVFCSVRVVYSDS